MMKFQGGNCTLLLHILPFVYKRVPTFELQQTKNKKRQLTNPVAFPTESFILVLSAFFLLDRLWFDMTKWHTWADLTWSTFRLVKTLLSLRKRNVYHDVINGTLMPCVTPFTSWLSKLLILRYPNGLLLTNSRVPAHVVHPYWVVLF